MSGRSGASTLYVVSLRAVSDARVGRMPHEHGGIARVRYSDLKEAARFAADAG